MFSSKAESPQKNELPALSESTEGTALNASQKMSAEANSSSTSKAISNENKTGAGSSAEQVTVAATVENDGSLSFNSSNQNHSPVAPADFDSETRQVLNSIDASGRVSKLELEMSMEDPSIKGQSAQIVATLYQNYDELVKVLQTPDEVGKGLSAEDLARLQVNKISDSLTLENWAKTNFDKFAVNGTITKVDLEKAIADPRTNALDHSFLQKIDQYFPEISGNKSALTISAPDLSNFVQAAVGSSERGTLYMHTISDLLRTSALGEGANINYNLYASPNALDSIKAEAIQQGVLSDCYFDAPLAAIAQAQPQLIADAIKDNQNGSYTVTFKGAPNEPIKVSSPTAAELGIYNGGSKDGIWPAVMEKAFGKYRLNHSQQFQITADNTDTPEEGADGTGYAQDAFKLLTGKDAQFIPLTHAAGKQTSLDEIDGLLKNALSKKNSSPTTAAVYGDDSGHTSNPELMDNHEYSISGYTPDGKGSGEVTLRNPLGGKDGGIIHVSLSDFVADFDGITIG